MTSESDRLHAEMERAWRQADHYARVAARLLNENRLAEARQYAARWRDASAETRWLLDLATRAESEQEAGQ
jgi:hypothetical protein